MAENKFYYGGQAVIEGVMMRGKQVMVTATRRPSGGVGVHSQPLSTLYTGRWRKDRTLIGSSYGETMACFPWFASCAVIR